jgi:hypothetical protein
MRSLTRGDMDALTSAVFLTMVKDIGEIRFAHPKDVQDGNVEVDHEDIIVNLPYVPGCGMWFDHHASEASKLEEIGKFEGRFEVAPSCARVVYNHFEETQSAFDDYSDLLVATDRVDAAQLDEEDVVRPSGWILLAYTLDPRSGLGPQFQKYFRWLVEYVKEVPVEKVLEHPEVHKRAYRVQMETAQLEELLSKFGQLDGTVILTDLRDAPPVPAGNRFLVYSMFPDANVELRVFWGKGREKVVLAAGHSIFNRTCNVHIGELFGKMGGGGHKGAGTVQIDPDKAEDTINEVRELLLTNQAL